MWASLTVRTKLWLIAVVAANALRTRGQLRLFIIVFLGCYALFPVRGAILNYFLYGSNLAGRAIWNYIYENPNDLAALTILQISMALGLLVTEPKGWVKWAAIAGCAVLPFLILLTQSRGAILALAVLIVLATWGQRKRLLALLDRRKRIRLAVLATALGAGVAIAAPDAVWGRLSGLAKATSAQRLGEVDEEGSARQRYEIWRVAARMIELNPLVGVGLGAYKYAHLSQTRFQGKADPLDAMRSTCLKSSKSTTSKGQTDIKVIRCEDLPNAKGVKDTHSTYLNVLAETGIPGFLIFVGMFVTVIIFVERVRRRAAAFLPRASLQLLYVEFGLLAFFVAGIFGSFADLNFLYIHLMLIWTLAERLRIDHAALRGPTISIPRLG